MPETGAKTPQAEVEERTLPDGVCRVAAIALAFALTFGWIPAILYQHYLADWLTAFPPEWRWYVSVLILGCVLTIWTPQACGLSIADTFARRRLVAYFSLGMVGVAGGVCLFVRTPFYRGSADIYLVTPIAEELLFRGFLFALFERTFRGGVRIVGGRVSRATLLSSVAFSLWHLGGLQLPQGGFHAFQLFYTFIAGLCWGILREKTRSLWPAVFIHAFVNVCAVYIPPIWAP